MTDLCPEVCGANSVHDFGPSAVNIGMLEQRCNTCVRLNSVKHPCEQEFKHLRRTQLGGSSVSKYFWNKLCPHFWRTADKTGMFDRKCITFGWVAEYCYTPFNHCVKIFVEQTVSTIFEELQSKLVCLIKDVLRLAEWQNIVIHRSTTRCLSSVKIFVEQTISTVLDGLQSI